MRLPTLPLYAILVGAYPLPLSRKDDEEVPPGEERLDDKEPTPPPKPDEIIIELKEIEFFGEILWRERDRGPHAFYAHLYRKDGRRKRKPKHKLRNRRR
jgi:hypothetical protein